MQPQHKKILLVVIPILAMVISQFVGFDLECKFAPGSIPSPVETSTVSK